MAEGQSPLEFVNEMLRKQREETERNRLVATDHTNRIRSWMLGMDLEERETFDLFLHALETAVEDSQAQGLGAVNFFQGILAGFDTKDKERLGIPYDENLSEWVREHGGADDDATED